MTAVVVGLAAASCAHVEAPPGGPQDRTPPSVLSTSPEDEAVVTSYDGPVIFQFTERISERGVEDAVIVSPRTSPVEISPGRSAVRVSLRNGWEPNVIYQITLRPEIRDLFNNPIAEAFHLVFSTGPAIPDTRVTGTVVDRITGRAAEDVRVEAIRMADSLVYAVATGSGGAFDLARIPEGEYLLRAFEDVNRNRALDAYEARDSSAAQVADAQAVQVAFRILPPDSTAPTIAEVSVQNGRVEIEFDDFLDPEQTIDATQVTILHPTEGPVEIERVAIGELVAPDTVVVVPADTAAALAPVDTVAVTPADTAAVVPGDTVATVPPDTAAAVPPDSAAAAPADLAAAAPPTPPAAAESAAAVQTMSVELREGEVLEPGAEYEVTVRGVRNINGLTGDAASTLEIESAPPDI